MKINNLIVGFVFVVSLLLSINSFAQNIVCIDPGYGEPGSSKYGVNGFSKKILGNLSYYHYLLIDSN